MDYDKAIGDVTAVIKQVSALEIPDTAPARLIREAIQNNLSALRAMIAADNPRG